MFDTDFLLKVLESNCMYYYDEEANCLTDYEGIKGSIRSIKTKIAIAQLVRKDPSALLQYIYDKLDFTASSIQYTELARLNAGVVLDVIYDNSKLFKILIKNNDPELLAKVVYKYGAFNSGLEPIVNAIWDDKEFGKIFCKGIMICCIDKYQKTNGYKPMTLLMKLVMEKMDTPIGNNLDYVTLFNNLTSFDYKSIYNSFMEDLCIDDEDRKTLAIKICEEIPIEDSKKAILKRKIEKGILIPKDLSKCFGYGMLPNYQAINSFLISNTFALRPLPIEKQAGVNLKELNKLLKIGSNNIGLSEEYVVVMMLSVGVKHTQEILEGKYGELSLDDLRTIFEDINLDDYEMSNKQVNYSRSQSAMIRFLFGNGVNDENSNIRRLLRGEVTTNLAAVVRNWKLIYSLSGGKVKLSEISSLLDDSVIFLKDYQQPLRSIVNEAGTDYLEKILETYEEMLQRSESTIPKVKGEVGNLEYEVLDLDSVEQMSVGYATKCCFTFEGASSTSLKHALTSNSGRILVIRKNGCLVAQSWLWRDGNVLCFDDIETTGLSRKSDESYLRICVEAAGKILESSAIAEPEEEKIEIVTVGISPNSEGIQEDTAGKILPLLGQDETIIPQEGLYTDAEVQYVLGKSQTFEHSKRFSPKVRYQDERTKIAICDPQQSLEEEVAVANQTIEKIETIAKSNREIEVSDFTLVAYGKDWFIGISPEGNVVEGNFGNDKRQNEEMKEAYKIISEKSKSGELTVFLDDANISKGMEVKKSGTK